MPGGLIKVTGEHVINVRVHPEVNFDITLVVEADSLEPSVDALLEESDDSDVVDETQAADTSEPDDQNPVEETADK